MHSQYVDNISLATLIALLLKKKPVTANNRPNSWWWWDSSTRTTDPWLCRFFYAADINDSAKPWYGKRLVRLAVVPRRAIHELWRPIKPLLQYSFQFHPAKLLAIVTAAWIRHQMWRIPSRWGNKCGEQEFNQSKHICRICFTNCIVIIWYYNI